MYNPDFEEGTTKETHTGQVFSEIDSPDGWTSFWVDDPQNGIYKPEMKIIRYEPPYIDPPRILSGEQSVKHFKQFGKIDCGIYQQTAASGRVNISVWGHAWYSEFDDKPWKSEWNCNGNRCEIHDGDPGVTLMLGVSYNKDPWGDDVIWTQANIYDKFKKLELEAEMNGTFFVFLRAVALYPFRHVDVYWDNVEIEVEQQDCIGSPTVDYDRTCVLLPQNSTPEQVQQAMLTYYMNRRTITFSPHDAGAWGGNNNTVIVHWFDNNSFNREEVDTFFDKNYPHTQVVHNEPEDSDFEPENYTPYGTKGGFHGSMGDMGQVNIYAHCHNNGIAPPATGKLVAAWGAAPILAQYGGGNIVGRVIDLPGKGNLEWYDASRDPIAQAEVRMSALVGTMLKYPDIDFWEIINEQNPPEAYQHADMARFFLRAIEIAESYGKRLACFSYSVGTPKAGFNGEPDYWEDIAETGIFERIAQGGHAIALHEYGHLPDDIGPVICRYRVLYEKHIKPRKLNIPLFITEYGVRREMTGNQSFVRQQFAAYDAELRKDPYALGFHAYIGPIGDPDYYNAYTRIQSWYMDYIAQEQWKENGQ